MSTLQFSSKEELILWLKIQLAEKTKHNPADITEEKTFLEYGLDSLSGVEFAFELEQKLNREISSTMLWDYPTIGALSEQLYIH